MDRRQVLAGLEWRKLQCPAAPSATPRRPRPRDLVDSPGVCAIRSERVQRCSLMIPGLHRPCIAHPIGTENLRLPAFQGGINKFLPCKGKAVMKALLVLLGILIAGATITLCFHAARRQNTKARQEAGLRAIREEELNTRHRAELESDRIERETEQLLWDAPLGLTQQRVLIAQELADDQVKEKESSRRGDPPDPDIALKRAALSRIDARLRELKVGSASLTDPVQTSAPVK